MEDDDRGGAVEVEEEPGDYSGEEDDVGERVEEEAEEGDDDVVDDAEVGEVAESCVFPILPHL